MKAMRRCYGDENDGDPLDILILMEASVVPGCIVRTRVIGGIEAKRSIYLLVSR
jgi:inorganic pyrophosphatase